MYCDATLASQLIQPGILFHKQFVCQINPLLVKAIGKTEFSANFKVSSSEDTIRVHEREKINGKLFSLCSLLLQWLLTTPSHSFNPPGFDFYRVFFAALKINYKAVSVFDFPALSYQHLQCTFLFIPLT